MSIRARLFIILIATTGALWFSATVWIYSSTRAQVGVVLDARLREAANMVNSLIVDGRVNVASAAATVAMENSGLPIIAAGYHRQLSCQIWSLDGKLVGQSADAPQLRLSNHGDGFATNHVGDEIWRVYAVENKALGLRVLVGDNMKVRNRIINDMAAGLILPAALLLPILAALIWLSVGRGLAPLRDIAEGVAGRRATDLHPLDEDGIPHEIAPVASALNGLFRRVTEAQQREKNFTAFAAHELKTPLSGLKMQAQIAQAATEGDMRDAALTRIVEGVDRSDRLVHQLLEMLSVEAGYAGGTSPPMSILAILAEVRADLENLRTRRNIQVDLPLTEREPQMTVHHHLVYVVLRNVMDNAIRYSPAGGLVTCSIGQLGDDTIVEIEDEGSGINEAEVHRVTERFFRGKDVAGKSTGSGLGLSIVGAAMDQMRGEISFHRSRAGGLKATIRFPSSTETKLEG